jgi:hypothetical protein
MLIQRHFTKSKVVRWRDLWFTLLLAALALLRSLQGCFIGGGLLLAMVLTRYSLPGCNDAYGLIALWIQMRRSSFLRLQNDRACR